MLVFVLFAGWASGSQIPLSDYPQFVLSGLMSLFGGVDVALPFMLDLMRIPADMYQIYVVTGIVNGRTATLLAAMNLLCFTLLVVASLTDAMRIHWRRVVLVLASTTVILVGSLLAARWYFETLGDFCQQTYRLACLFARLLRRGSGHRARLCARCRSLKASENPAPFGLFVSGNRLSRQRL